MSIVGTRIPEILQSRKVADVLLVVVVILLGALSFGLGRLSMVAEKQAPVALCVYTDENGTMTNTPLAGNTEVEASLERKFVASKNSSVYHLPWCSGAKRISEKNKVWFATKAEAEQVGYRPASNCKGL